MTNAVKVGNTHGMQKAIRLGMAPVVATVVLETTTRVDSPNILGIAPLSPANLITNILGLPEGRSAAPGQGSWFAAAPQRQGPRLKSKAIRGILVQDRGRMNVHPEIEL